MTKFHKLIAALRHDDYGDAAHVHFHQGPQGSPAACHDAHCAIPRLTVGD